MEGPFRSSFRDPVVRVLLVLIVGCGIGVGILLVLSFTDMGWRIRWSVFGQLPPQRVVFGMIRDHDPSVEALRYLGSSTNFAKEKAHVHDVQRNGAMSSMAVVAERYLDCPGCEDLLFMVMYDIEHGEIEKVWVMAGLSYHATPEGLVQSLDALVGTSFVDSLSLGEDVALDGVSGATESGKELIERLNEISVFLRTVHLTTEGARRE